MEKSTFFEDSKTVHTASAPGRLDVMGGVADYAGSLLLQMPIKQKSTVSIAGRNDTRLRVYSKQAAGEGLPETVEIDLSSLDLQAERIDFEHIRDAFAQTEGGSWALYVAGCFILSMHKRLIPFQGADAYVDSDVPIGKGVSSSAAIEVSTLCAIAEMYGVSFNKLELPILAQQVENSIVGAPCGLMDQLSSYLGRKNRLLPIVCQPASVSPLIDIPEGLHFIGIDSDVQHSVSGRNYGKVRTAAFMGYTLIALDHGTNVEALRSGRETGNTLSLPYRGYLANIEVDEFENRYLDKLPDSMKGRDFLEKYKISIDLVTAIDPEESYNIKVCASHPVYENRRIKRFMSLLVEAGLQPERTDLYEEMGRLMVQSHESYSACGLGHENTDEIIEMVKQAGSHSGVHGGRVTGGGNGGTVCVLAYGDRGLETATKIWQRYQKKHQNHAVFFRQSSDGAFHGQ